MPIFRYDFLRIDICYLEGGLDFAEHKTGSHLKQVCIKIISIGESNSCFAILLTDKQESELYISYLVEGNRLSYLYCNALSLAKMQRDSLKKTDHKEQILLISSRFRSNYKNIIIRLLKVKIVFTLPIETVYYADV